MLEAGTNIVAGVSPGKAGFQVEGVPVYETVKAALREHVPDISILFVPPLLAKESVLESLDAGLKKVVVITEGIPVHDAMEFISFSRRAGALVVGPNTVGIISPERCKVGIMPHHYYVRGEVGLIARSGTLGYEIVANLRDAGYGISTAVGLGGDRVTGLNFVDALREFERDVETKLIVLVGEIGGGAEEEAAEFIAEHIRKPVIACLAGRSAPPGKRMGHAGAIIERGKGTFRGKVEALEKAGVRVAELPFQISTLAAEILGKPVL